MFHKYIDKETFEIVDNVFEVDEDIAETISILNKKGYYTKYCCSGHVKNPRIYEKYPMDSIVDNDNEDIYIVPSKNGTYNYLMPTLATTIYIMFAKQYKFNSLPNGFCQEKDTIEKRIEYYDDNKKRSSSVLEKEIKDSNQLLLEWAKSLPICKEV